MTWLDGVDNEAVIRALGKQANHWVFGRLMKLPQRWIFQSNAMTTWEGCTDPTSISLFARGKHFHQAKRGMTKKNGD